MLIAYFDESGIHEGSPGTVIGGFLAPANIWQNIESEWKGHLDYFKVPYFHMAALEDGHEPLDKLSRELRYGLYKNLIKVLLKYKPTPIATAMLNDDWLTFDRSSDAAKAFFHRYPEPYDYCFDEIAQFLDKHSKEYYSGEAIKLVFSEQLEYESRARFVYDAFKTHAYWKDRFISLAYSPMKMVPALQCADIMAYDTYSKVSLLAKTRKAVPIEGLVKDFFDHGMQPYARYADSEALKIMIATGPKWFFVLPKNGS